jgi:hypothetical protein
MTDVKGYTPLTDYQKDLANEGKVLEERVMRWLDKVAATCGSGPTPPRFDVDAPIALLTLGKRSIQQGFMWSIRSIFQPVRIALPEDDTVGPP